MPAATAAAPPTRAAAAPAAYKKVWLSGIDFEVINAIFIRNV